ncbi:hypothetical protein [Streptomyces melanogenes]|uniref:hypothetical protein n=1 Tax=Streptomyces melanogenes TaxID=67326 RepID=UPI0037973702
MNLLVVLAVVLGLALIGAIAALIRTELRPAGAAAPAPRAAVTGREALDAIDLGLRRLAADCVRAGRSLPDVYALGYSGGQLALHLTNIDHNAPAPWTADEEGEEWRAESADLGSHAVESAAVAQPYPLAVTVGMHQGERLLIDLSRASAPIAVTGDGEGVRQLVRALVTELITGPVGRRAEVTLVGSAATAEMTVGLGLMSARLHTVATLDEGLSGGPDGPGTGPGADSSSVTQVFRLIEGRGPVGVQGRAPRLFVLHAAQFLEERAAMAGLNTADALLVLGEAPDFAWRFQVAADGSLDTGPLGLRIALHAGRMPRDAA